MKNSKVIIVNKDKNEIKMKKEIRSRLESNSWDFSIAYKVMQTRNSEKEKRINTWTFASLATAAMSFMVFMAGIYFFTIKPEIYTSSGSIYSYAYINNDSNLDNDIIAGRLELTINEVYPMR